MTARDCFFLSLLRQILRGKEEAGGEQLCTYNITGHQGQLPASTVGNFLYFRKFKPYFNPNSFYPDANSIQLEVNIKLHHTRVVKLNVMADAEVNMEKRQIVL